MITNRMAIYASDVPLTQGAVCEIPLDAASSLAKSLERMKSLYQAEQQAKFLNLQAETEDLLHHLQALKEQRTADQL
jgi:hypothetical protein